MVPDDDDDKPRGIIRAAADLERARPVTARLVEGDLNRWAVTYTEVKDVSDREAKSRLDVTRARHVEPYKVLTKATIIAAPVVGVLTAGILWLAQLWRLDWHVIVAAEIMVGAPFALLAASVGVLKAMELAKGAAAGE